jgi:hypothetical protein
MLVCDVQVKLSKCVNYVFASHICTTLLYYCVACSLHPKLYRNTWSMLQYNYYVLHTGYILRFPCCHTIHSQLGKLEVPPCLLKRTIVYKPELTPESLNLEHQARPFEHQIVPSQRMVPCAHGSWGHLDAQWTTALRRARTQVPRLSMSWSRQGTTRFSTEPFGCLRCRRFMATGSLASLLRRTRSSPARKEPTRSVDGPGCESLRDESQLCAPIDGFDSATWTPQGVLTHGYQETLGQRPGELEPRRGWQHYCPIVTQAAKACVPKPLWPGSLTKRTCTRSTAQSYERRNI